MVDCQCHGNLGFSGFQFLIGIVVTHANILSSERSTGPRGSGFNAIGMLSYRTSAQRWNSNPRELVPPAAGLSSLSRIRD